jgi:hypothetical protein
MQYCKQNMVISLIFGLLKVHGSTNKYFYMKKEYCIWNQRTRIMLKKSIISKKSEKWAKSIWKRATVLLNLLWYEEISKDRGRAWFPTE